MKRWPNEVAQFDMPHYSTMAFEQFLASRGCFREGTKVLDIGSGLGANFGYFSGKNPGVSFLGLDYNADKVEAGKHLLAEKNILCVDLELGDWFNLPPQYVGQFDGIYNCHTLCCFKRIEPALQAIISLSPRWLAFNSLFYEGPMDVLIHIRDYNKPAITDDNPDGDFNIFSLANIRDILSSNDYVLVGDEPFYPPKDLPRPAGGSRGSYTMRTELHERTQFSGTVYLPWRFILAERRA